MRFQSARQANKRKAHNCQSIVLPVFKPIKKIILRSYYADSGSLLPEQ